MNEELNELQDLLNSSDSSELEKLVKKFEEKRPTELPDVEEIEKQLDPNKHDVFDKKKREDKKVKADEGEIADAGVKTVTKGGKTTSISMRWEKVARIGLAYQEQIVNKAAAFAFGTPVKYNSDTKDANEIAVLNALKRIIHDNKMQFFDQDLAQELFGYTEVAELWYPIDTGVEHTNYGFPTKMKLRVIQFKLSKKEELFPYFDKSGDLIAFGRKFSIKEEDKEVEYFDVFTADNHYQYRKDSDWELMDGFPIKINIGKIPIAYVQQEKPEFDKVKSIIADDENLRSNFSDTNAYHSNPTTVVKGKINGFSKKGQAGKVIEIGQDADVRLLESQNAAEGVKTQHLMNREDIYSLTQTPDVSFNSMKSIGNLGAAAQKLLFMDAHLKVKSKEIFLGPFLQRRISIIKSFIADFNQQYKQAAENVMISAEITPFIMGDDKETVDIVTQAVNAGVMSKKLGVQQIAWAQDTDEELQQIAKEQREANTLEMFPPAG
ncbi:phage portal protein [Soonwooa purpurea]